MLTGISLGLVAAVASAGLWPVLPGLPSAVVALSVAGMALLLPGATTAQRHVLAVLAGVALGLVVAVLDARALLASRLPTALAGIDQEVIGVVQAPRLRADGTSWFLLEVPALPWDGRPGHLLLSLYEPLPLADGERWQLQVRLRRPRGLANPGAMDGERFLFAEGVVATGYVRTDGDNRRLAGASLLPRWRSDAVQAVAPLHGAGPGDIAADDAQRFARAVLPALVLDDRSLLTAAHWQVLAATGTAHLVAISGLHIGIVWGLLFMLLSLPLRRRPARLRQRLLPVSLALLVAVFYAALAGFPLPVQRAVLMIVVATACLLLSGRLAPWRVWLLAAAVLLLVDPRAAHSAGWWLSFGAVAVILLLLDTTRRLPPAQRRWWQAPLLAVQLQWWLGWLLAPLLLALFGVASVASFLANLVAVPLVNLLVLPMALLAFLLAPWWPLPADVLVDGCALLLAGLWQLLAWLDGRAALQPLALPAATLPFLLLLAAAGVAWRLPLSWPARLLSLLLALLAWPQPPAPAAGTADVTLLDVGQGLAVLVRTHRHAVLYDAGPAWGEDSNAGARVVVPALQALGVRRLDLLLLSHADNDHDGGAPAVLAALAPRAVLAGMPEAVAPPVPVLACDRMRRWQLDGVTFLVLPAAPAGDDNDRSCVLHVAAGDRGLLLPGDISRRREIDLVARYRHALRATVLVAAHHGSRSSSSETLLATVAPARVLFAHGYRNRFGHPHPRVLQAVRRHGAVASSTAVAGALQFRLVPGQAEVVQGWRRARRRFWHEEATPAATGAHVSLW